MKRYQLLFLALFSSLLLSLPWLAILPGWILFIAFLPLLILEDQLIQQKDKNKSIVFWGYAYLAFVGWNALTCWWIVHATLVGMILVVFLNACFMATVWWLFHLFRRNYKSRISGLALVSVWLAFEFAHHYWDIEWPWLTLGNGFADQVKLIQWYEYTGVLGGSLWVFVINLLIFDLYRFFFNEGRILVKKTISIALIILLPISFSIWIYSTYKEEGKPIEVVVLQPNIDPYIEKFGSLSPGEQINRLILLADSLVTGSTDYVVAPETSIHPLWQDNQLNYHRYILPFYGLINRYPNLQIVAGATTKKMYHPGEELSSTVREFEDRGLYYDIYNSALQIDKTGKIQLYHKSILVSGVEKMPFSKYFTFIEGFIIDLGGTTGSLGKQDEPSVFLGNNDVQVAPVICYESVFGAYLTKYIQKGADLIFIITNDGWWKETPGYKQHLSYARLRAIETRRSIVRSANTGISAIINQRGEYLQKTQWWEKTVIKDKVYTNEKLTFYVKYGDYIGRISSFIAVLMIIFLVSQGQLTGTKKIRTNSFVQNP